MEYLDLTTAEENKKVLLVDDHQNFLEGVKTYLEIVGYEVLVSKNVYDAVKKFQQHPEIQLVISDFDFGNGSDNGLYIYEAIRQSKKNTPLLLLTMHHNPEIILSSLEKGVNGFIFKENCYEDILFALDSIQNGNSYLCSQSNMILEKYQKSSKKVGER